MLGLGLAACNEATEDEGTDEEQTEETSEEAAAMTACDPGCEMMCCKEGSTKTCDKSKKECPKMGTSGCHGKMGESEANAEEAVEEEVSTEETEI